MKLPNIRNSIAGITITIVAAGVTALLHADVVQRPEPSITPGSPDHGLELSIGNYTRPRDFVGFAHDVFVAKIIEGAGEYFTGDVVYTIKGKLQGNIELVDYQVTHDLQVGSTYLMATRGPTDDQQVLTPGSFASVVSTNPTLTNARLSEIAGENEKVQELLVAYVYEKIYWPRDARNTFASLSQDDKNLVLSKIKYLPPEPTSPPPENTAALCSDRVDNDEDHDVDLVDPDCAAFLPPLVPENTHALCSDKTDNDRDFMTDLRDPDCAAFKGPEDTREFCADGLDNDGDYLWDLRDPDCTTVFATPTPTPPPLPPPVAPTSTSPTATPLPTSQTSSTTSSTTP